MGYKGTIEFDWYTNLLKVYMHHTNRIETYEVLPDNIGGEHVEIVPVGFNLTDNPVLVEAIREKAAEVGIEISNYAFGAGFAGKNETEYETEIGRVLKEVDIAARLGVKLMRHDVASVTDISMKHFTEELPLICFYGEHKKANPRIHDYVCVSQPFNILHVLKI
ncbi:hypothetical protein [Paenibacillus eucommiae]|uniref:Uncharacterized protein n=1 Tax=Paenibacillus eucommiae TaxID=1355755 RepID=A0ABS4ITC1_9BACL|nr:hypothetical protein [Paenibacillus eucommiae]MBP1990818.1 hypothetical protein [Paenibacillus eucommiae]